MGDTALRLAHWFNTGPQFWMNLQAQFDLVATQEAAGDEIKALPTGPEQPEGSGQPEMHQR